MRKYTKIILLILAGPMLIIGLFNTVINPYDFFMDTPEFANINKYKPVEHDRQIKAYRVITDKPDVIILGSSRSRVLPVEHKFFQGHSVYNLALNGATGYETFRYFQHANVERKLTRVILGIGEDFSAGSNPGFSEERLSADQYGNTNVFQLKGYFDDLINALFTSQALKDSVRTIKRQHEGDYNEFSDKNIISAVRRFHGQYNLSVHKERQVLRKIKNKVRSGDCAKITKFNTDISLSEYTYFYKIIDMAYQNDIEFNLFFYPVHSRLYEIYCASGYWPKIEQTKREVVKIVEELAVQNNKVPFTVWDFSGYNRITTEPYPEEDNPETLMQWYIDPVHYSAKTGKLIFDRMFNYSNKYSDFGTIVSGGNIDVHLAKIRNKRMDYAKNNKEIVNEIKSLVRLEYKRNIHEDIKLSSRPENTAKRSPQL